MRLLLAGLLLLIAHVAHPKPKPEPKPFMHNGIFENPLNPLMAGMGAGNPLGNMGNMGMQGEYQRLGMMVARTRTRMIHPLTGQVGYFFAEKPELCPMCG